MIQNIVIDQIKEIRRDLCNLLFHFTRPQTIYPSPISEPNTNIPVANFDQNGNPVFYPPVPTLLEKTPKIMNPIDVLYKILREGKLKGNSGYIKGNYNCVCFTEAPISELSALFSYNERLPIDQRPRYTPYGIAVTKDWLYQKGGRPVIYQSDSEYYHLTDQMKWRHVRYEPPTVDFSWEREWRINTEELLLEPASVLIIVPTAFEAYKLTYEFSQLSQNQNLTQSTPKWLAVSLDIFK